MTTYTQAELAKIWRVSIRTIERMRAPNGPLRWRRVGRRGIRFDQEHIDECERDRQRLRGELQRLQHPAEPSLSTPSGRHEVMLRARDTAKRMRESEARTAAKAAGRPPPKKSIEEIEEWAKEAGDRARKLNARKEAKRTLRRKLRAYRFKAPS